LAPDGYVTPPPNVNFYSVTVTRECIWPYNPVQAFFRFSVTLALLGQGDNKILRWQA